MSSCLFNVLRSPPRAMHKAVTIELFPDPFGPTVTLKFGPEVISIIFNWELNTLEKTNILTLVQFTVKRGWMEIRLFSTKSNNFKGFWPPNS